MSLSSHAPDPPHQLGLGAHGPHTANDAPSGIPVLKSRAKSMARSPSPELPTARSGTLNEPPPFRVDLDAALAEIEDELEVRAIQKFASARPNPVTVTTPGTRAPRKSVTAPTTPVTPVTPDNPVTSGGQRRPAGKSSATNGTPNGMSGSKPRTPRHSLGRAATLESSTNSAKQTRPANARKRHGSDGGRTQAPVARVRRQSTNTTSSPQSTRSKSREATPKARVRAQTVSPPGSLGPQTRLGVAAHFVPPETNFTPPKGADWDDVVLPAVAKKLGISVASQAQSYKASSGWDSGGVAAGRRSASGDDDQPPSGDEEMDLAVEWDREGTPIRWAKVSRSAAACDPDGANSDRERDTTTGHEADYRRRDDYYDVSTDDDFGRGYSKHLYEAGPPQSGMEMAPIRTSAGPAPALAEHLRDGPQLADDRDWQLEYHPQSQDQPPHSPVRPQEQQQRTMPHTRPAPVPPTFPPSSSAGAYPPRQAPRPPPHDAFSGPRQQQQQQPQPANNPQPGAGGTGKGKMGSSRDDSDDIKRGGCACIIM